jgi:hypothetical protein
LSLEAWPARENPFQQSLGRLHASLEAFDVKVQPGLCFEHLKSGNADLQIGGFKNAIRENGVPRLATVRAARFSESVQCKSTARTRSSITSRRSRIVIHASLCAQHYSPNTHHLSQVTSHRHRQFI